MEIILVDDGSPREELHAELDNYIAAHLPKVRVIRLADRSGLIVARIAGAKAASGDVLIFLDSHTEANVNWSLSRYTKPSLAALNFPGSYVIFWFM